MKVERSKLARLVVAYHERFGRHVPESAMRALDAGDLAPILENSLATGAPLAESGWQPDAQCGHSPRGCCIVIGKPKKGPDGEWLQ